MHVCCVLAQYAFLMRLDSVLHGSEPHMMSQQWEEHMKWLASRGGGL